MSEVIFPKIKLFGKTIELPETSAALAAAAEAEPAIVTGVQFRNEVREDRTNLEPCSFSEDINLNRDAEEQVSNKSLCGSKETNSKEEDQAESSTSEDLKESYNDAKALKASKNKEDQNESSDSQDQKTLKKPDKIIPCPRCNSMETKFCYFNNYNVNQPRHFCKNCQRYWTAGGTMRNVPVGAGRRKNKHVASQYHHITVPESLSGSRIDLPNGLHSPSGLVLPFGSNTSLCELMVSDLSIVDKKIRNNGPRNVFQELEVSGRKENGESGSSPKAGPKMMPNCHLFPPTIPCFPPAPWGYPFYPAIVPGTLPVQVYPTGPPYWNCAVPGAWNVPLIIPPVSMAPSVGPVSPTLGKHLREESVLKLEIANEEAEKDMDSEKCLWVLKTLRIDDPGEAAKSSIWATLGIKKDREEFVGVGSGGSLCKAFESKSKGDENKRVNETSSVLQANPAALSRSLSFQESS